MTELISRICIFLIRFIGESLRIRVIGKFPKERTIFIFWHSDSFALLYIYRSKKVVGLASTHRDGEIMARVAGSLGYTVVRGSSKSKGVKGLIALLKVKEGSFALTPDGPRGPRHCIKLGIPKFAELSGLPIVPVGVYLSNKIRFKSWDRYQLPLPLSRCIVYMGDAISITHADENACTVIKNALLQSNLYAEQIGKSQVKSAPTSYQE